jgi:hypothetical protein
MTTKQSKPKQQRGKSKESEVEKPLGEIIIDFDSNWKYLIIKYFYLFVAFFMPDLYADIDPNRPPVFLDNELQTIWRSMKTGLKMTDKLVQVWLKNGDERLILVHIEVQARFETLFSKRMFTISYRIVDKYKVQPVALALFVDTPIPKEFDTYEDKLYGTETRYKYNAYKIIDQIEADLLKRADNLFALVVLANLRTVQTKKEGDEIDRLLFKKHLYNLVIERNFDPEVYYDLLNFINYLMVLPEELAIEYDNFSTITIKKEAEMNYLKPAPGMKSQADAIYLGAYGVDIAAERLATKRQIQVEKRKARLAEAKAKETENKARETENKARETENKAKNAYIKIANFVRALRFDRTAEEIAAMADISIDEVKAILDAHPLDKK